MPTSASWRPSHAALLFTMSPYSSSSPTAISSTVNRGGAARGTEGILPRVVAASTDRVTISRQARDSGRGPSAKANGPIHVVQAGHHRDQQGGRQHVDAGGGQPAGQGQDVQAQRNALQQGLELAALARRDHPSLDDPEAKQGDADLTSEDHHRHPPGKLVERGKRDQGGAVQRLVGDRVSNLPEVRHQVAGARHLAVKAVSDRGQCVDRPGGDTPGSGLAAVHHQKAPRRPGPATSAGSSGRWRCCKR